MRRLDNCFAYLWVALAFGVSHADDLDNAVHASIDIVSIDPAQPKTGDSIVVHYRVSNSSVGNITLQGDVVGILQGAALNFAAGSMPISVPPKSSIEGQAQAVATTAGVNSIELTFKKHCRRGGAGPHCKSTRYAATQQTIAVEQRMVEVRIAGRNFARLGNGGGPGGFNERNGGVCVVHRPDCGTVGHDGEDRYFGPETPLPAGAKLVSYRFRPQWPQGLSAVDRGGLGSSGSYGAQIKSTGTSTPVVVRWENACQGPWRTLPIVYSMTFVLSIPAGSEIGEPTFAPSDSSTEICEANMIPTPLDKTGPPVQDGVAGTILTRGTPPLQGGPVPYSGSFGANPGGVILAIENGENFAIELVGDGNTTDDCGKNSDKTKVLPPHGRISTTELKALFGSEQPRYPRSLYGCSYVDRPLGIGLSITYRAGP